MRPSSAGTCTLQEAPSFAWRTNARFQPLLEAYASLQLLAVGCKPLFGGVVRLPHRMSRHRIRLDHGQVFLLSLLRMIQIPAQLQVHPEIC